MRWGHVILYSMKTRAKDVIYFKQNSVTERVVAVIFIILSLMVLYVCVTSGMGDDIWYDELFSLKFMENSYNQIVALTAADVHPPFYYWYLKAFHDLGQLIIPGESSVVLAKMASVAPFLGIWLYAFTLVRKRMGIMVAGVFLFLIGSMPQISNYVVEIRMYSLAMFCITALFLHSYEIILEDKKGHWLAFLFYGILTAYTQYYACIAVVAVYIALFMYFLFAKRKAQMIKVIVFAGISVVAYLPWIPSFINQFQNVSSNYWIQPLTFRSIFGCMKFIFLAVPSYPTTKNYILAVAMIGIFGLCFLYGVWKAEGAHIRYLLLCGIFIPVFVTVMGFVCSALNRPIFVYRYLVPGLGAMWLVAAYVLLNCRKEIFALLLLVPFLAAGHSNMAGFQYEEGMRPVKMVETTEMFEGLSEDAVILCNFNHVQAVTAYYLDNKNVLYGGEPEALIKKLLPNCVGLPDTAELQSLVTEEDVYFLGSFEAREALLEEWKQYGITYTEEGTYLLERYWFNVYHLKRSNL